MANEYIENAKQSTIRMTKKILWISLIALIIAGISYFMYRNYNYSTGTRSGSLVKISEKGWLFKTYEGELNLAGSGGMMTETSKWTFSATKSAFIELQKYEGKQVTLHYDQKVDAFPWQGDTDYIVDKVESAQ
jgi:preprotein translocase subunit SecF